MTKEKLEQENRIIEQMYTDINTVSQMACTEFAKMSRNNRNFVSAKDIEDAEFYESFFADKGKGAINFFNTEATIIKTIKERKLDKVLPDKSDELTKKLESTKNTLQKGLQDDKEIKKMVCKGITYPLITSGLVIFHKDGRLCAPNEKNALYEKITKNQMPIKEDTVSNILSMPENKNLNNKITMIVAKEYNTFFADQDTKNSNTFYYNPEKVNEANIKQFNQKVSQEIEKEVHITKMLDDVIKNSGLEGRSDKVIQAIGPALEKYDPQVLENAEYRNNLAIRMTDFLKGSAHTSLLTSEKTITTERLNKLAEMIGDENSQEKSTTEKNASSRNSFNFKNITGMIRKLSISSEKNPEVTNQTKELPNKKRNSGRSKGI
jgi:hypothetical protein